MNSHPKSSSLFYESRKYSERSDLQGVVGSNDSQAAEAAAELSCTTRKQTQPISSGKPDTDSANTQHSSGVGSYTPYIFKPGHVNIGKNNNVNHIQHHHLTITYNFNISGPGSNRATRDGNISMSLNDRTRVDRVRGMSQSHTQPAFHDQSSVPHSSGLQSNVPVQCTSLPDVLILNRPRETIDQKAGVTPLHLASQNGHDKIVNKLLSRGANVNARDNDGWTALHLACQNGHLQAVKLLVNHGADVNISSACGVTPMHLACQNGHDDVVEFLSDSGAEVNVQTGV